MMWLLKKTKKFRESFIVQSLSQTCLFLSKSQNHIFPPVLQILLFFLFDDDDFNESCRSNIISGMSSPN